MMNYFWKDEKFTKEDISLITRLSKPRRKDKTVKQVPLNLKPKKEKMYLIFLHIYREEIKILKGKMNLKKFLISLKKILKS